MCMQWKLCKFNSCVKYHYEYECVCECKLNVYMDDELTELSAEVNGSVCLFCIYSWGRGVRMVYLCYMLYPFMKESVNDIHVLCIVPIRGGREVHIVYMYYMLYPFVGEGECKWYTCVNMRCVMCITKRDICMWWNMMCTSICER